MAGTLGGVSVLDGDTVRANYTTANSRLKHNWITALARVGDEWFAGTYGAGVLRLDASGEWHSFPDLKDGLRGESERHGGERRAALRRQSGPRPVRLRSRVGPLDAIRPPGCLRRTSRRWRPAAAICTSERTTAWCACRKERCDEDAPAVGDGVGWPVRRRAPADTGVLIPGDRQQPDPAVFSLNEMAIEIRIDNGVARVRVRQIFGNHSGNDQEGVYQFALPGQATVSDFAVWDDVTRIPGVILERRRAGEIYEQAKAQAIDPGLLQMGERTATKAAGRRAEPAVHGAHRADSAFGTKRIEMEYQHPVAVERYRSEFVVPLKPDVYGVQTAGHLTIAFELRVAHAIQDFEAMAKTYPLQIRERTPNLVRAEFFGEATWS